jgi:hypothetical protein
MTNDRVNWQIISIHSPGDPNEQAHPVVNRPATWAGLVVSVEYLRNAEWLDSSLLATLAAGPASSGFAPPVLARNADGSINSCTHASEPGSAVSLYLNGVGLGISLFGEPPQIFEISAIIGGVSAR